MIVVAVCATCAAYRYKSRRDYHRGEPLDPNDFDAIPPQLPAAKGDKAVCVECGALLQFRYLPPEAGAPSSLVKHVTTDAVITLFEARPGESVTSMRDLGPDRLLVVTDRRILIINLEVLLLGANGHVPSA